MSRTKPKDESKGMDEANLKTPTQPNPAFPSRSSREPDEVGSEDMCEHGMNSHAVVMIAERHLVVAINNERSSAGPRRIIVGESLNNRINGWGGGVKNLG